MEEEEETESLTEKPFPMAFTFFLVFEQNALSFTLHLLWSSACFQVVPCSNAVVVY